MTYISGSKRAIALLVACALNIPHYAAAQSVAAPPVASSAPASTAQEQTFTQEQLDQMLAPIALYPDAVLSQNLMASTYPLEVVQADRWCKAHPKLTPAELQKALASEPWDPSVKSLCAFGTVLDRMSRDLTWTRNLGEAFVGQQPQVMGEIQALRSRARNAGTLVSNSEQLVTISNGDITIVPRDPQVVYVPTYNPNVAYGKWWWPVSPYYPAYWAAPGGIPWYWGAGIAVGLGLWGLFDWHHHRVDIDLPRYNRLYGEHLADAHWRFNPAHHGGVGFRSPALDHMYGHFGGDAAHAREHEPALGAHGFGEHFGGEVHGSEHFGEAERLGGAEHFGGEHLAGGGFHGGGSHGGGGHGGGGHR
ncbi:MAG: hypothetical protein JWN13_6928 [Betaproteobacteria bacterium]|nr:hypothetical protein [Betaproteobacteria bacterium]